MSIILINNQITLKPGEKFEFSLLMHEINVLSSWTILAINVLIQDLNLDQNIRSILLYHWANKKYNVRDYILGRKGFEPSLA